jgi:hypothetical protein
MPRLTAAEYGDFCAVLQQRLQAATVPAAIVRVREQIGEARRGGEIDILQVLQLDTMIDNAVAAKGLDPNVCIAAAPANAVAVVGRGPKFTASASMTERRSHHENHHSTETESVKASVGFMGFGAKFNSNASATRTSVAGTEHEVHREVRAVSDAVVLSDGRVVYSEQAAVAQQTQFVNGVLTNRSVVASTNGDAAAAALM